MSIAWLVVSVLGVDNLHLHFKAALLFVVKIVINSIASAYTTHLFRAPSRAYCRFSAIAF